jgi:hypothetical protein
MTAKILSEKEFNNICKKQGEYFGYPSCCVKSFIRFVTRKGKRYPIQDKNSHPEGFVPCLKHARLLEKKMVTIKELIQNRISKVEFAFENYMTSDKFYNGYTIAIKDNELFYEWLKA